MPLLLKTVPAFRSNQRTRATKVTAKRTGREQGFSRLQKMQPRERRIGRKRIRRMETA